MGRRASLLYCEVLGRLRNRLKLMENEYYEKTCGSQKFLHNVNF